MIPAAQRAHIHGREALRRLSDFDAVLTSPRLRTLRYSERYVAALEEVIYEEVRTAGTYGNEALNQKETDR